MEHKRGPTRKLLSVSLSPQSSLNQSSRQTKPLPVSPQVPLKYAAQVASGEGYVVNNNKNDSPLWLDDYNTFHDSVFVTFVNETKALGGDLAELASLLQTAFDAHKNVLLIAANNGRPNNNDLQQILKPLSEGITAIQTFRESKRSSKQFNHLSAMSEAIPFLGWVAVAPKPAAYVQQMEESGQFYTNKILKEFRESDPKQANWSKSLIKMLKETQAHVKDNHGTGLMWNKDKPAATGASAAATSAPAANGGAPPPPPPGPPPPAAPDASSSTPAVDTRAELFAALNKGTGITTGLKKVTDDMKTHKNPTLRGQSIVPAAKTSNLSPRPYAPATFKKFSAPETKKPPVFELQMKKWIVEYQEGNQNLVIENTNDKQTIYMFKCKNSVLQVKGKVNSITLDSCQKCGVVFEDLISTCEFVNCQSIKAQANGKVPTISVDKTDGVLIYLNDKSLDAQIISAKSSEMNVCITKEDGDLSEHPIPEQYKTVYDGKKFVTTTMDLNL
ncbi:adenylyl cyclase-associated protein-like isoform X1 [Hydractinia symbiolongicarpus]|uniref:adenylyl cyclase-associated protein-like isoform X1 n=1 Tax=Hydractinia symbiolongicarpus TaxID=13093 RepID=UPI00254E56E6|nr:adenylyl cyclase-associated protein-like isoform X1 [Hydractinia symbiolongicarpus]